MAFRYSSFGRKITEFPEVAHADLVHLFKKHVCSTNEIAGELGVNVVTLRRWIKKLETLGYSDPGKGYRRVRGGSKLPAVR